MADIISLDDFRELSGLDADITFIGPWFEPPERGGPSRLMFTVDSVPYERILSTIEDFRRDGGIVLYEPELGKDAWFFPWPPAAIRIRKAAEGSEMPTQVA